MSLRARVLLYLIVIHFVLGGMAFWALLDHPWLLVTAEIVFIASAVTGYHLVRSFFIPLELIQTGAELMRERDFSCRFSEVGQPEMDDLISIYNSMIDQLREQRLKMEERNLFLDKVLDASPSGVVTLCHDGTITQINPAAAALAGDPEINWLGKGVDAFPDPIARALRDLADGGSAVVSFQGSRRLKIRRGSFYDRGFSRGFFLIEELTEELRASEKAAYEKLIRMMSHEVNNSSGAVRSLLESCRSYGKQIREADRDDFIQAMDVAALRLLNLNTFMNGLAEVVRIPRPDLRPCNLPKLLDDIAFLIQPEMERQRIRLAWIPPDEFPEIDLDKNQMEQVLVNILRNAADAIGEEGTVTVSLDRNGRRSRLTVRDSGTGISPEAEAHLFSPFFSTKRQGQGIGLTLVREILSQHALEFDLRNVEGGAEFRIFF